MSNNTMSITVKCEFTNYKIATLYINLLQSTRVTVP